MSGYRCLARATRDSFSLGEFSATMGQKISMNIPFRHFQAWLPSRHEGVTMPLFTHNAAALAPLAIIDAAPQESGPSRYISQHFGPRIASPTAPWARSLSMRCQGCKHDILAQKKKRRLSAPSSQRHRAAAPHSCLTPRRCGRCHALSYCAAATRNAGQTGCRFTKISRLLLAGCRHFSPCRDFAAAAHLRQKFGVIASHARASYLMPSGYDAYIR